MNQLEGCGRKIGALGRSELIPFCFSIPEWKFALRPPLKTFLLCPNMTFRTKHNEVGSSIGLRQSFTGAERSFVVNVKPSCLTAPFAFTPSTPDHLAPNNLPSSVMASVSARNPSRVFWAARPKLASPCLGALKRTELILASLLGLASLIFLFAVNTLQSSCRNAVGRMNELVSVSAFRRTKLPNSVALLCVGNSTVVTISSLSTTVPIFLASHIGIIT